MSESAFNKFLGTSRFQALAKALRARSHDDLANGLDTTAILAGLVISFGPAWILYRDSLNAEANPHFPIFAIGICTILALFVRSRLKLRHYEVSNWRESFSLMHTSFALGCIPAVAVLLLQPDLLATRNDMVSRAATGSLGMQSLSPLQVYLYIAAITVATALWAAITEEYIFRGLLVSTLRRWKLIKSQASRDRLAIVASALAFGAAHFAAWGPYSAIALVGLGAGFALGYIANGEQIAPCIVYHFAFDILSISASFLLR